MNTLNTLTAAQTAQLNNLVAARGEWLPVIVQPNRENGIDQWIVNYPKLDGYAEFHTTDSLAALGITSLGDWEDAGNITEAEGDALCETARTYDASAWVGFTYWRNC